MAANFLGFLLEVLRYMEQHWELLVNDIEQGTIDLGIKMSEEVRSSLLKKIQPMPERAQELRGIFMQGFEEPIVPKLWLMHSSLPVSVPVDLRFMLIRSKRNIWEKK